MIGGHSQEKNTVALPRLENWLDTRLGLHRASQVVGRVRRAVAEPEPNWTHLGLRIMHDGLTTGLLAGLGTIDLHFADRSIVFTTANGDQHSLSTDGHNQLSLADAVEVMLRAARYDVRIDRSKIT